LLYISWMLMRYLFYTPEIIYCQSYAEQEKEVLFKLLAALLAHNVSYMMLQCDVIG
jgi:hypothetical protein